MSQPGPSNPKLGPRGKAPKPRRKAPKPTGEWRTKPRAEMTDDDYQSEYREKFGKLRKNMRDIFDGYLSKAVPNKDRVRYIRDTLFEPSNNTPCDTKLRNSVDHLDDTQVEELCHIVHLYHQLLTKNPYFAYTDGPQKMYYKYYKNRDGTMERLPVSEETNRDSRFRAAMLKSVGSANETHGAAQKLVRQALEIANSYLGRDKSYELIRDSDTDYSD